MGNDDRLLSDPEIVDALWAAATCIGAALALAKTRGIDLQTGEVFAVVQSVIVMAHDTPSTEGRSVRCQECRSVIVTTGPLAPEQRAALEPLLPPKKRGGLKVVK